MLTGANGSGKTTLLRTLAGFIRPVRGTVRLEGGDKELTIAEQAHVVGHANAVKAQPDGRRERCVLGRLSGFEHCDRRTLRGGASPFRPGRSRRISRRLPFSRTEAAARPRPVARRATGRCGCSTSRRSRWTRPRRKGWSRLSTPTLGRAASPSSRRICRWRSIPPGRCSLFIKG